ncbi:MAG: twin-arginine translocase TatA/TatE family subunit [Gemmatimonadota bacterium]|nr:twin-arginine translocase TatA/TatE family subunit [Gemmatimonadota bacterium]MEC7833993.1 twin-arginine translocase TatA/TatE family subunit [Gemmatimonadota bacterium]
MGFGGFGMWEMILIFTVVLLLFGAKKLPEIGSSLGKGIREFKSSVREIETELKHPDRQIHKATYPPGEAEDEEDQDDEEESVTDDGPRSLSDD